MRPARDAIANASQIHAPAILITADADTLVPPKYQEKIIAKYQGPVRRMHLKNKGHWQSVDQPAEIEELNRDIDWLFEAAGKP